MRSEAGTGRLSAALWSCATRDRSRRAVADSGGGFLTRSRRIGAAALRFAPVAIKSLPSTLPGHAEYVPDVGPRRSEVVSLCRMLRDRSFCQFIGPTSSREIEQRNRATLRLGRPDKNRCRGSALSQ